MRLLHHVLWQSGSKKRVQGKDRLHNHGDNPYTTKSQVGKVKDRGSSLRLTLEIRAGLAAQKENT